MNTANLSRSVFVWRELKRERNPQNKDLPYVIVTFPILQSLVPITYPPPPPHSHFLVIHSNLSEERAAPPITEPAMDTACPTTPVHSPTSAVGTPWSIRNMGIMFSAPCSPERKRTHLGKSKETLTIILISICLHLSSDEHKLLTFNFKIQVN